MMREVERPGAVDALIWLWRGKVVLGAGLVAGVILSLVHLSRAIPLYTAELQVSPTEVSPSSVPQRLGGIAALAGINLTSTNSISAFDQYVLAVESRDVAQLLAADEALVRRLFNERWDPQTGRWLPVQRSWWASLLLPSSLEGARPSRPDAAELQDFIKDKVKVAENAERGSATVILTVSDPELATRLVRQLHRAADGLVRRRALIRSREYIFYLQQKLRTVTLAEHREALAQELGQRERTLMIATSSLPFSAEPLGDIVTSARPTSPRPGLILPLGAAAGLVVGLLALLTRDVIRIAKSEPRRDA